MHQTLKRSLFVMMVGVIIGYSSSLLFAETKKEKNCGGDPPSGSTTRTDNENCEGCPQVKNQDGTLVDGKCKYADKKYKICQDDGSGCTWETSGNNAVHCTGKLWTKVKCEGSEVGNCQMAKKNCTN